MAKTPEELTSSRPFRPKKRNLTSVQGMGMFSGRSGLSNNLTWRLLIWLIGTAVGLGVALSSAGLVLA